MTERGAAFLILKAAMEPREAQSLSQRLARPGSPTTLNCTWVPESWRATPADRKAGAKGASQALWRLPALHPLIGETEKGTDGRRTSLNNRRAKRWLFEN